MAAEPVWVLRVNYQAVPACEEGIFEENENCERSNSGASDKLMQNAPPNGKRPLARGRGGMNNNYAEDAWRIRREEEVNNMAASENNGRVVISVAGMRYETYESTLARLPDSLLGSPSKRAPYYHPTSNELRFNRNRNAFDSILFYYQSGATDGGILVKPDGIPEETFVADVRFFELGKDAERKLGIEKERKRHGGFEVISMANSAAVTSRCQTCLSKIGNLFEPNRTRKMSPLHRIIDVWTIFITVFFVVLLCGKTLPSIKDTLTSDKCCNQSEMNNAANKREIAFFWSFSEKCCISWFTLEYMLRAFSANDKKAYLRSAQGIFDLLSFFPYIVQILIRESISETGIIVLQRILVFLTFFSVFKLTRYSVGLQILLKTIETSVKELALLLICVGISLVLFSSVIYYSESTDQSTMFTSIPATFWFIIVTMTTVGYGDMTPTTVAGKIFSALCAVFGVCCVLAIPSTIIVTNFNFFYVRQKAKPKKPKRPKTRMTGLQKWVTRFRTVAL